MDEVTFSVVIIALHAAAIFAGALVAMRGIGERTGWSAGSR
jgi:hypothetical protein